MKRIRVVTSEGSAHQSDLAKAINANKRPRLERAVYAKNLVELRNHFTSVLVGQEETFKKLAAILYSYNQKRQEKDVKRILPLVLSGVSGTGKTESTKLLRRLYQIDDDQYVYFDLARCPKEHDTALILGAAPGLAGCTSRDTVPMMLLRAINRAPNTKLDLDETEDEYRQRTKGHTTPPPPDCVLLHFDELDKAHESFLTLLINFMETGRLTSSSSSEFVLPDETRLIIVFTANFGATDIEPMTSDKHFTQAQEAIRHHMEYKGIHKALLGRLRHILPFFQLDESVVQSLVTQQIRQILDNNNHEYRQYYDKFNYNDDVVASIKERMLQFDRTLGMRSLEAKLEDFKQELCSEIVASLLEFHTHLTTPLQDRMTLSVEQIAPKQHDRLIEMMRNKRHLFSPTVRNYIEEQMVTHSNINLLTVRYRRQIMTCFISLIAPSSEVKCHSCQTKIERKDQKFKYRDATINGDIVTFRIVPTCHKCVG
jgi:ATP-dependent Clp protease ATP-binding subunit ClpA